MTDGIQPAARRHTRGTDRIITVASRRSSSRDTPTRGSSEPCSTHMVAWSLSSVPRQSTSLLSLFQPHPPATSPTCGPPSIFPVSTTALLPPHTHTPFVFHPLPPIFARLFPLTAPISRLHTPPTAIDELRLTHSGTRARATHYCNRTRRSRRSMSPARTLTHIFDIPNDGHALELGLQLPDHAMLRALVLKFDFTPRMIL